MELPLYQRAPTDKGYKSLKRKHPTTMRLTIWRQEPMSFDTATQNPEPLDSKDFKK